MHRIMNEEITRSLERERSSSLLELAERERSRSFLEETIRSSNPRVSDLLSRIDIEVIQRGNKLHELTSPRWGSIDELVQMEEILSGNNNDIVKRMVNERDHNGNTPLHNAVRSEFLPAIRLLFEHGADCFIQNKKGQTPYGLSSKSDLVQDLFQNCSSVKEKIKEQREQQYSHNINKLLNIPQIKSKLCKNEKPYRKVPNCEGACSTLQELSVNKILDSCCLGG